MAVIPQEASPRSLPLGLPRLNITSSHVGFTLATLVFLFGWWAPLDRYITPKNGIGYWLGIVGGSLMLLLLIYPLRKRVTWLNWAGGSRAWFTTHMIMGIVGPLMIFWHCNYRLGATNSNVAFWCMVLVVISGIVGRYLYARIHHGLYGRNATLGELRTEAERLKSEASGASRILPDLTKKLDHAEKRIGTDVAWLPRLSVAFFWWRVERSYLRRYVRTALKVAARHSTALAKHRHSLEVSAINYVEARLTGARRVAEFESAAKLFALWHVAHIPFFIMLIVAGVVHVVAVHLY